MALELRPNCERCDADLPPGSGDARICSYECTFCATCAHDLLRNVCPNCGGGFERRPLRPAVEWRPGVSFAHQPASRQRRRSALAADDVAAFVERVASVDPERR